MPSINPGVAFSQQPNYVAVVIDPATGILYANGTQLSGVLGTTTNNNAPAGYIGEIQTATVAVGSAQALTTATPLNNTSLSLTAGDWDVSGTADFIPAASTSITLLQAGLGTTTATFLTQAGGGGVGPDPSALFAQAAAVPGANVITLDVGPVRVSLAASATIFFVAQATFTVAALSVYGTLRARRVR